MAATVEGSGTFEQQYSVSVVFASTDGKLLTLHVHLSVVSRSHNPSVEKPGSARAVDFDMPDTKGATGTDGGLDLSSPSDDSVPSDVMMGFENSEWNLFIGLASLLCSFTMPR